MKTKYYSCSDRALLEKIIKIKGNYYEDNDIIIDVVGKVNTNSSIYDENGNIIENKEPIWTDYLFNVIFKNENKKELFDLFKEETPKTPFRKFL